MGQPVQKHWDSGLPAIDATEIQGLQDKAKLVSIKFLSSPSVDYQSEAMGAYINTALQDKSPSINLRSKF